MSNKVRATFGLSGDEVRRLYPEAFPPEGKVTNEQMARDAAAAYVSEVQRRILDNDWPKADIYGPVIPCTPAVYVPMEILERHFAEALASRALEEAKWWAKNGTHGHVTDEAVERIAALEQAAASKAAGGGQ